jgi:predicted outer membrane protein
MKYKGVLFLAGTAALLWAVAARAERETEPRGASPNLLLGPSKPATAAPRPAMFAAASAATFKRLEPEQREEWRFLKDAAAGSRFEAEASRLALVKSNDAAVRAFAATLANHHSEAGQVLQHMLHVRSMAPPMLSNDQRKALNRLAKLQGVKFDREYMEEVGARHQQEDVLVFQRASTAVRDPSLKDWIDRTLPTMRFHLATAERVMAHDARLAKPGSVAARAPRTVPAPQLIAAPADGNLQLGPAQPVAVRSSGSSNR